MPPEREPFTLGHAEKAQVFRDARFFFFFFSRTNRARARARVSFVSFVSFVLRSSHVKSSALVTYASRLPVERVRHLPVPDALEHLPKSSSSASVPGP